ncbi:hypothetical protein C8J57DRAFT_1511694 [Mycena rebaudengoi]|nr:hypothetical protein C8J57DRAFT_1511694 [Mycena rebaudengoi]
MVLQGFTLHADVFPDSFIWRYHLPVLLEHNMRVASTAFEVFSHSGDLVASCAKYSVAWVDMNIVPSPMPPRVVFQQVWTPKELGAKVPAQKSKLLYLGKRRDLIDTLSHSADKYIVGDVQGQSGTLWPTKQSLTHVLESIELAADSTIILDATQMNDTPESPY